MRELIKLEESGMHVLKNATYYKTYFIDSDMAIIVIDLGVGSSVPIYTKNAKPIEHKLGQALGMRVKLIPRTGDIRSLAMHLLYPARLLGVNTLWLPDGSIEYVVRVNRRDRRIIEPRRELYERILGELAGKKVRIRFE